jgi:hypothetical protein
MIHRFLILGSLQSRRRRLDAQRRSSMTLRHASALALVGWYLLAPPVKPGPKGSYYIVDTGAPFRQWLHVDNFDTANGCKERQRWLTAALNNRVSPSDPESLEAYLGSYSSECVATDDPRLMEK